MLRKIILTLVKMLRKILFRTTTTGHDYHNRRERLDSSLNPAKATGDL